MSYDELHLPPRLAGNLWFYENPWSNHQPHQHRELEFNLVISGTASYVLGNRCYELRPRTNLWLFPDQTHQLVGMSKDFSMWVAVFRPSLVRQLTEDSASTLLAENNPVGSFCHILAEAKLLVLTRLCEDLQGLKGQEEIFNAGLGYLMLRAYGFTAEASESGSCENLHPALSRALDVLSSDNQLQVEELAARSVVSVSHLSRLFQSQLGMSISDYRNELRIKRFMSLYSSKKNINLLRCALESGFGSYAQFYRAFVKGTGYTPREYSKNRKGTSLANAMRPSIQ